MNEEEFHRRWSDRSDRYPDAGPLPAGVSVHLHVDPGYAETYSGQVAAITAASLFSRMTRCVAVDVPPLPILDPLPWTGTKLDEFVMETLHDAHRSGKYEQRAARTEDLRLVIGSGGDGLVVHGSGWGAYRGFGPSPLLQSDDPNPFGAAFAVIDAAAQIQLHPDGSGIESESMDTYLWRSGIPSADTPSMEPCFELGDVWSIGVGSVGSCALFFLGLITRNFRAVLVDCDNVEIENVTALGTVLMARRSKRSAQGRCCGPLASRGTSRTDRTPRCVVARDSRPLDKTPNRHTRPLDLCRERAERAERDRGFPPSTADVRNDGSKLASDTIPTHPARRCLFALCAQRRGTSDADVVCNRITCP